MLKVLNLVQKVKDTKKLKLIQIKYFVGIYSGQGITFFSMFVNVLDMINVFIVHDLNQLLLYIFSSTLELPYKPKPVMSEYKLDALDRSCSEDSPPPDLSPSLTSNGKVHST